MRHACTHNLQLSDPTVHSLYCDIAAFPSRNVIYVSWWSAQNETFRDEFRGYKTKFRGEKWKFRENFNEQN